MSLEITKEFLNNEINIINERIDNLSSVLEELEIKVRSSELFIKDIENELNSAFTHSYADPKKKSILEAEKELVLSGNKKIEDIKEELTSCNKKREKLISSLNEVNNISSSDYVSSEIVNSISISLDVVKDNISDELNSFDKLVTSFIKVDPNRINTEYRKFKKEIIKYLNEIEDIRNKLDSSVKNSD